MARTIKAGVIGTGFIGPIHIEAIRRTFLGEVVALADINDTVAAQKAAQYGVPRHYGDYRNLLKDPEVEVVHICTPNNLHYTMTKEALLAGKHVVCEKPLTATLREAEELLELADKAGLANAVHFNVRYYPLIREARTMVQKGTVGQIYSVQGSYLQDWLYHDTDYSWRLEPEMSGESRAIADIGSHWFDLTQYVTGMRVTEVMADFATFHKTRKKPLKPIETWSGKLLKAEDYQEVPINTEDYASVLLRYENGSHGVMTVHQMYAGRKNRVYFEIGGSKTSLNWDSERPNEMMLGYRDKANEVLLRDPALMDANARKLVFYPGGHNEGFPDTSKQLFKEFYQYILDGNRSTAPQFPAFLDGYREMVLCEAIVSSAKTGRWVEVRH
mgnify:FL=1